MSQSFIPPYLLEKISAARDFDIASRAAAATLRHDETFRAAARGAREVLAPPAAAPKGPDRTIADARGGEELPGTVVRTEGAPASTDVTVNEAYDGLGATYAFYSEVYHRNSIDGWGMPLNATVHYGQDYDNAFWNGSRMVFGDGDGEVFGRFTVSVSVIGHELTHGVTQHSAGLSYADQAGALNESISDVFGALVEQYTLKQTADQASWLIGAGLFTAKVKGVAIRSMKAPGTAYDDPRLGKDPQPATMRGYVQTSDDNGGVHINSGIPNHAFYLVATRLGGHAWERAGRIWYETLTGPTLRSNVDFAGFAEATVATATRIYGAGSPEVAAVNSGWQQVGVTAVGVRV
jgi:Zn-dependent metalloprotease